MRHQLGIGFVPLAGAQLPGQLAVQLGEGAVATEQPFQSRQLARVGVGAEPAFSTSLNTPEAETRI